MAVGRKLSVDGEDATLSITETNRQNDVSGSPDETNIVNASVSFSCLLRFASCACIHSYLVQIFLLVFSVRSSRSFRGLAPRLEMLTGIRDSPTVVGVCSVSLWSGAARMSKAL